MFHHWRKQDDKTEQCSIKHGEELINATKLNDEAKLIELLNSGVPADTPEYNRMLFYQSKNYMTPLHYACQNGFTRCAELLIKHGADVNIKDRFDVTPIHLASEHGHLECLSLLLENDACCNVRIKYSRPTCYPTSSPYVGGSTPLHLAALSNHVSCVIELIRYAADYNVVDEEGQTSMHVAAVHGFEECVNAHLDNAIGRYILSLPSKASGDTPLHTCITHKLASCVTRLLKHGSDINHKNKLGLSPLHHAVSICRQSQEKDALNIVFDLIANGYNTDVNLPDAWGMTPLQSIAFGSSRYRCDLAVCLISFGASHEITDKKGVILLAYELKNSCATSDKRVIYTIVNTYPQIPHLGNIRTLPTYGGVVPKHLRWYQQMSQNVRSLQHCCRYAIRTALGVKRLNKIKLLPIPPMLKEYLLKLYEATSDLV